MRRALAAFLIGMSALAMAGCANSADRQDVRGCNKDGSNATGCFVTVQYHGKPLECISWSGDHGEVGLTCDFVGYYGNTFTAQQPVPSDTSTP